MRGYRGFGLLLSQLMEKEGITLEKLADRYNANKPPAAAKIGTPQLSRYRREGQPGGSTMTETKFMEILMYGFSMTPKQAKEQIAGYMIDTHKANVSREKLSSIFHIDPVNIHPSNLIPVYSDIGAGFRPDSTVEIVEHFPNLTKFPNNRVFGAIVNGDSMEPTIRQGDRIIILKDGFGKPVDGDIYVFWTDDQFTVKRVKRPKGADHMLLLTSDNSKYDDILLTIDGVKASCVGQVLEIHRRNKL